MDGFEKALGEIRLSLPTSENLDDLIDEIAATHSLSSSALRNRIERKWGDIYKYNKKFPYISRGIFDIDALPPDIRYDRLVSDLIDKGHDFYRLDPSKWNVGQVAVYIDLLAFWKINEPEMKELSEPASEPWWREWKENYFEFKKQYPSDPA